MTHRRSLLFWVVNLSVFCMISGCPVTEGDQPHPRQGCPIARIGLEPGLTHTEKFEARAGERIVAFVQANGGVALDVYPADNIPLYGGGTIIGDSDRWDKPVTKDSLYRANVLLNSGNYTTFFSLEVLGVDTTGASCDAGRDRCFGAEGPNCDLCEGPVTDLGLKCRVTVGSQEHDSCCSFHPDGSNCDGLGSGNGQGGNASLCAEEWNKAVSDRDNDNYWYFYMDPTVVTHRPKEIVANSNDSWRGGLPLADAIRLYAGGYSLLMPATDVPRYCAGTFDFADGQCHCVMDTDCIAGDTSVAKALLRCDQGTCVRR